MRSNRLTVLRVVNVMFQSFETRIAKLDFLVLGKHLYLLKGVLISGMKTT